MESLLSYRALCRDVFSLLSSRFRSRRREREREGRSCTLRCCLISDGNHFAPNAQYASRSCVSKGRKNKAVAERPLCCDRRFVYDACYDARELNEINCIRRSQEMHCFAHDSRLLHFSTNFYTFNHFMPPPLSSHSQRYVGRKVSISIFADVSKVCRNRKRLHLR